MDEIEENSRKIKSNITFLAERTTNIKKLMILLVKKDVISHSQLRAFMREKTDLGKLFMLYTSLSKTVDNRVFGVLIGELNRSGNQHIFEVLVPPVGETVERSYYGGRFVFETSVELGPKSIDHLPGEVNHIEQSCAIDEESLKQKTKVRLNALRSFSLMGYYGKSPKTFIKFEPSVESRLLMSISFERIKLKMTDLINALRSCGQLKYLTLNDVDMTGTSTERVHLPRLKVSTIRLRRGDVYGTLCAKPEVSFCMERVSFFYKDNSMKDWKFRDCNLLGLDWFNIALGSDSIDINYLNRSFECKLDNYDLDEILQSLRFAPEHIILENCKLSIKSLIQIGSCLTRLHMDYITFIGTEGREIELSKAVLRYLPQLESLQILGSDSETAMSINISHLPLPLTKLRLSSIKLLYYNDASMVANNSPKSHKMRTIHLQNVALPFFEYEIKKLFGQFNNIFINGYWNEHKPTASLLDKLVKIDPIQIIRICGFDWESFLSGSDKEFSSWRHQIRIPSNIKPEIPSGFALEKVHRKTENEELWRGRELNFGEFDSLFNEKFYSPHSG